MESFKWTIQIDNSLSNYFPKVLKLWQFDNYIYQINDVLSTNPRSVLIVGDWTWIVRYYLEMLWITVKTFDIDENLKPDFLGSIHEIQINKFKNNEFDTILASHVLEHIPYKFVDGTLKELSRISKYVIIHLPYPTYWINWMLQIPLTKKKYFKFGLPIFFWKKHKFNWQHYRELWTKWHSIYSFIKEMKKYFKILKKYTQKNNQYSYNFIWESKNNESRLSKKI